MKKTRGKVEIREEGVKNTRGNPITYNSIQHILNNQRYFGEFAFRDTVIPDGIPAIVPQDLFDRVQEKLSVNKKAPARHKAEDDYLLTIKIFCGYCRAYLCGESGTSRTGEVHHYYKCVSVKKKRTACECKPVRKVWLENLVLDSIIEMLADDRTIDAITSMVLALQDQESTALPMYEQQLQEANTGINNLLNAIQQGILTKSTKTRLEELEAARDELENKIALEKLAKPRVSEEQVRFFLQRFRALDIAKPEQRKTLIDVFLNAVYVFNDKIVISCNYKDGTKTINFSDMECALTQRASVPGSDLDCPGAPKEQPPPFGVVVLFTPAGTRIIIESPGGAFIVQCAHWAIPLFAPISREAQMHASPRWSTKPTKSEPDLPYGRRVRIMCFLQETVLSQRYALPTRLQTAKPEKEEIKMIWRY